MQRIRLHLPVRALTIATIMCSWLIATNHCALGLMQPAPETKAEHARCCAGKSAPAKKSPADQRGNECCRTIIGAAIPAKAKFDFDASQFALQVHSLLAAIAPKGIEPALLPALDTGPPHALSFAESVLQRCLLSHAPPVAL